MCVCIHAGHEQRPKKRWRALKKHRNGGERRGENEDEVEMVQYQLRLPPPPPPLPPPSYVLRWPAVGVEGEAKKEEVGKGGLLAG